MTEGFLERFFFFSSDGCEIILKDAITFPMDRFTNLSIFDVNLHFFFDLHLCFFKMKNYRGRKFEVYAETRSYFIGEMNFQKNCSSYIFMNE